MNTIEKLIAEWDAVTLIKIFESPVYNAEGDEDYIVWNITHNSTKLIATPSEGVETVFLEWDECFSLDEHLQELHTACIYAINDSSLFEYREE
jgi:hypothetical protein